MKGVIFDLDGVIVSTDTLHYQAWKALADELDIYFDEEINNGLRGASRMDSLNIILECCECRSFSEEERQMLAERKNQYYKESLHALTAKNIENNVHQTLAEIKEMGLKIAIGSSSCNAKTILLNTKMLDAFDVIVDGNDIEHSKPHPEVFIKAAERLKIKPTECLVVEDAVVGISAAKAAGMTAVLLGCNGRQCSADYVISDLSELIGILRHTENCFG